MNHGDVTSAMRPAWMPTLTPTRTGQGDAEEMKILVSREVFALPVKWIWKSLTRIDRLEPEPQTSVESNPEKV
uniref:Uncharacterized protein n=1 Tax=Oryza nivara TaxID=4536 RepID=A0A0E0GTY7_ORYNI